jgi:hypothetical protein
MNSFYYLSDSEWNRFYNLIMWLKHERISRECFAREWRLLQEGTEKK